jgi:CRP-like cAMP-binding protein
MIAADRLSKLSLFAGVTPAVLAKLGEAMDEKNYSSGDSVIREGEKSGSLFIIAHGAVSVEAHSKVVARLEAEEFFGEMAFLGNEPHSATVTALEATTLFVLPRSAVDMLIKREPAAAIDQLTALFAAVSSRLRRTTEELVTVFDVARMIGGTVGFEQLIRGVLERVCAPLGKNVCAAFYRWNPFNDEYGLVTALGPDQHAFPIAIEVASAFIRNTPVAFENISDLSKVGQSLAPLTFDKGHALVARADGTSGREGLFVYYNGLPASFDAGKRQLVETISAVMAPALESARAREEEIARERLARSKQASL